MILYLDFDGVLHPDAAYWKPGVGVFLHNRPGHTLFEHALLLESLLAPHPAVRIVLSTSWVPELGYSRARKRLPQGLAERVVGATYHSRYMRRRNEAAARFAEDWGSGYATDYHSQARGEQVCADVKRRRPEYWLALDNDPEGWPAEHRHQLILTDDELGIGEPRAIAELQAKLRLDRVA